MPTSAVTVVKMKNIQIPLSIFAAACMAAYIFTGNFGRWLYSDLFPQLSIAQADNIRILCWGLAAAAIGLFLIPGLARLGVKERQENPALTYFPFIGFSLLVISVAVQGVWISVLRPEEATIDFAGIGVGVTLDLSISNSVIVSFVFGLLATIVAGAAIFLPLLKTNKNTEVANSEINTVHSNLVSNDIENFTPYQQEDTLYGRQQYTPEQEAEEARRKSDEAATWGNRS